MTSLYPISRFSLGILVVLVTAGLAGAAVIPVTQCGQALNIKGGKYALTGDLGCGCETIVIGADRIHLDTAGFSVTSTCNVVAISDSVSNVTIDGGGSLSGGGGIAIGADRHIEVKNISVSGDGDLGGNGAGIELSGAKDISVSNCVIGGVFGITGTVDDGNFTKNTIAVGTLQPNGGIVVSGSRNLINNNTISNGTGGATDTSVGISVTTNSRVSDNSVSDFFVGVEFSGNSNVVTNNTVTGTGPSQPQPSMDGIEAESGAKHNRITKNTAGGNVDDLYENNGPPCVNVWRNNTFSTSGGAVACIH